MLGRKRGRDGAVLCAQVGDQLRDLRVGERVAKGRHLLSAIENLSGDFGGRPVGVLADVDEAGCFFAADAAYAVAKGAAFVAKQHGAGLLVGLGVGGIGGEKGGKDDGGCQGGKEGLYGLHHDVHFLMLRGTRTPFLG